MKVSIVILNWKGSLEDCQEAVESAHSQKYKSKEIIFVDNGSNDGVIHSIQSQFKDVKTLALTENFGVTGGRNRGASVCTGDLIVFLENDGVWESSDVIDVLVNIFIENPVLGVAYTAVSGYCTGVIDRTVDKYRNVNRTLLLASSFRGGASIIRRRLFLEIGGFPEDYFRQFEEKYFSLFAYDFGFLVGYVPVCVMRHKGSDYTGKVDVVNWYNCANDLKRIIRHYPLAISFAFSSIKLGMWGIRFIRRGKYKEIIKVVSLFLDEYIESRKYKKASIAAVYYVESDKGCCSDIKEGFLCPSYIDVVKLFIKKIFSR